MSGGHWGYVQHNVIGCLTDISIDIKKDMPELSRILGNMSNELGNVMHELETAEDTIWFDDNTTVFEMCWSVGEKHGYGEKLRQEFPQYA